MRYDREYFQSFCPSGYVVLRVRPDEEGTDVASVLLGALGGERIVAGTIDDLTEDALWVTTDDTYLRHQLSAGNIPFGPVLIGSCSARERIPYENIVGIEGDLGTPQ